MTDYELVSLYYEINNGLQVAFMNYVAILFAFLVAGFFAADKLSRPMVGVVIVLFTLAAFQEASEYLAAYSDVLSILPDIRSREALDWHLSNQLSDTAETYFNITYVGTAIIGYLGALFFFFHQRHQGLKAS